LLSIDRVSRLPRSKWATATVGEVADRDRALLVGEREDVAHLLDRSAFQRVGRAVVVDDVGRPVGIVSDRHRAYAPRDPHQLARRCVQAPGAARVTG